MIGLNTRLVLVTLFIVFIIAGSLIVLEMDRNVVINPYKKCVVTKKIDDWRVTCWIKPESIFSNQNFEVMATAKYLGTRTYRVYVVSPIAPEIIVHNASNGSVAYSVIVPSVTKLETIKPGATYNFSVVIGPNSLFAKHTFAPGKYIVEVKMVVPVSNSTGGISIDLKLNVR